MSVHVLIQQYTAFNQWANQKIVQRVQQEAEELWYMEATSSFATIDFTLQHILRTERFWTAFIRKEDTSNFDWSVKDYMGLQIQQELLEQSDLLRVTSEGYTEAELTELLELKQPWANNTRSRWEYILHVVNHSTFHRGQIITQLRCLGIQDNLPATDYNMFRL